MIVIKSIIREDVKGRELLQYRKQILYTVIKKEELVGKTLTVGISVTRLSSKLLIDLAISPHISTLPQTPVSNHLCLLGQ